MPIHRTHRYTHTESQPPPKLRGAWEANRAVSGGMRVVGGERRPRTALETLLCSRSSAECAMGGRDGWRLRKSSDGVVMIGMCLRTGGIPGTAGSWQLGKGEKYQRWMV